MGSQKSTQTEVLFIYRGYLLGFRDLHFHRQTARKRIKECHARQIFGQLCHWQLVNVGHDVNLVLSWQLCLHLFADLPRKKNILLDSKTCWLGIWPPWIPWKRSMLAEEHPECEIYSSRWHAIFCFGGKIWTVYAVWYIHHHLFSLLYSTHNVAGLWLIESFIFWKRRIILPRLSEKEHISCATLRLLGNNNAALLKALTLLSALFTDA